MACVKNQNRARKTKKKHVDMPVHVLNHLTSPQSALVSSVTSTDSPQSTQVSPEASSTANQGIDQCWHEVGRIHNHRKSTRKHINRSGGRQSVRMDFQQKTTKPQGPISNRPMPAPAQHRPKAKQVQQHPPLELTPLQWLTQGDNYARVLTLMRLASTATTSC